MAKAPSTIEILLVRFLTAVVASTILLGIPQLVDAEQVTLIAGGDVEWSRVVKAPEIYYDGKKRNKWERILNLITRYVTSFKNPFWYSVTRKVGIKKRNWLAVPYLATPQSKARLEKKFDRKLETSKSHHIRAIEYGLEFSSLEESMCYPFKKARPVLLEADISFANLETPLSDHSRYRGDFRTPTAFAKALKWAGIDVVSTANNHALDAEGAGLLDTQEALLQVDIGAVGSGRNLADARRPFIIKRKGITVAFLGYSQFIDGGATGFALPDRSGVVPLDPFLIKKDIQRLREQVDFVILSFHWGWAHDQNTHPEMRKFAHAAIDAGADVILGHHPHVPRGIEVYKEKVIIYSLGNFIFGHNHDYWMDNYLARLTLTTDQIEKVEIIPISGKGKGLAQPHVLKGESAHTLLRNIQILTEELNTEMQIEGDMGVVILRTNTNRETVISLMNK